MNHIILIAAFVLATAVVTLGITASVVRNFREARETEARDAAYQNRFGRPEATTQAVKHTNSVVPALRAEKRIHVNELPR